MKAAPLRTGSTPIQKLNRSPSGGLLPQNNTISSPRITFRSEPGSAVLKRCNSDTDMIRSGSGSQVRSMRSGSFPDMSVIVEEEMEFDFMGGWAGAGDGNGKGNKLKRGGNNGWNDYDERNKIGEYYKEMLKSNPCDSLLLRNYGKYLHEVEKDAVKAEECYGRAILASPGDGELLSLYGNLIWETQRDEDRAKSYFDQAVHAAPDDCMVLGSYAHFLWEANDDDEEENEELGQASVMAPALIGAY